MTGARKNSYSIALNQSLKPHSLELTLEATLDPALEANSNIHTAL